MFFRPRIQRSHKRILEIGPGALPHPLSDVWLDYDFDDAERKLQSGGAEPARGRICVFYSGRRFPFRDHAFDYVIASHVIEHVAWDALPDFISEMQRVAKAGYIELPRWPYELFFDVNEHVSTGHVQDNMLTLYRKTRRMPGADLRRVVLGEHRPLRDYLQEYRSLFFCGLEWESQLDVKLVEDAYPLELDEVALTERMRAELAESNNTPLMQSNNTGFVSRLTGKLKRMLRAKPGLSREQLLPLLENPQNGQAINEQLCDTNGRPVFRERDGDLVLESQAALQR